MREENDFSFVQEKIKHQPVYQNKTLKRIGSSLALAVLCGAVACFVFVKLYPWMERTFGEEKKTEITIPREEEESQAELPPVPEDPIVIQEPQELDLEDYRKLCGKLQELTAACEKSMVIVTAASSDTDWFNETYESEKQMSGLLVGNNGVELLVLTAYSDVKAADRLKVTFADKSVGEAALKNFDTVTDLAIISVNLADVDSSTLENVKMADLGGSANLKAGDPVIAVGSPAGSMGSVFYGNLALANYTVGVVDGQYKLLVTDIVKAQRSSGVLLNLEGRVVGLIENKYANSNYTDALTAYAISDMKDVIEHLSNSQDLVYVGITGVDVTEKAKEAEQLPSGVYVTGVQANSPAMSAGIQNGDIITEISGKEISSIAEMQQMLLKFSKDQVVRVQVMRQGKEGYKEIICSVALNTL